MKKQTKQKIVYSWPLLLDQFEEQKIAFQESFECEFLSTSKLPKYEQSWSNKSFRNLNVRHQTKRKM